MSTASDSSPRADSGSGPRFPAYGPVDAVLGYVLFYVVVDHATPAVVDVLAETLPDASPSLIRLGLAATLWVVLAVTAFGQLRRQLAALGVGTRGARSRRAARSRPSLLGLVGNLAVALAAGFVAAVTFASALETVVALLRLLVRLEVDALVPAKIAVMIVFFVAFGIAARSADKLIIGSIRAVLPG